MFSKWREKLDAYKTPILMDGRIILEVFKASPHPQFFFLQPFVAFGVCVLVEGMNKLSILLFKISEHHS